MKIKKTTLAKLALAFVCMAAGGFSASAQSLEDLGNLLGGGTLGNIVEGIFSNSKISVADIAGDYTSTGPAVAFKSDNLLKKAGGMAGAAALESKLDPYYKKYGLDGIRLSIATDGNFTMTVKGMPIKGTLVQQDGDANFCFNFAAFGKISLGKVDAYIEKSGNSINVMFDASKLKSLISTVANFSGISLAKTLSTLLDSYDGATLGFKMTRTGGPSTPAASQQENGIGDLINGVLNGGSGSSDSTVNSNASKGIDALKGVLGKKKK